LATASVPLMLEAPGRFSTVTGWPSASCTLRAVSRAVMSMAPPGGAGTMMRMGLAGKAWAPARPAHSARTKMNSQDDATPRVRSMRILSPDFWRQGVMCRPLITAYSARIGAAPQSRHGAFAATPPTGARLLAPC